MHQSRWLNFFFIPLVLTVFSAHATPTNQLSPPAISISAPQDNLLPRRNPLIGQAVIDLTNGPAAITVSTP